MKNSLKYLVTGVIALMTLNLGRAATAQVGQPAPDFTLTDISGHQHSLSEFKGRTVVLEWVNPECPFVKKHYDQSGNIPKLQQAATAGGIVWLSINSAATGKEGDFDAAQVAAWQKRINAFATDYFRDQSGAVGKLYDARTTPHLYVINAQGTLVYAGGIDSIRSSRVDDIAKATNYVTAALEDLKAGRPVRTANSLPYGCSVKY